MFRGIFFFVNVLAYVSIYHVNSADAEIECDQKCSRYMEYKTDERYTTCLFKCKDGCTICEDIQILKDKNILLPNQLATLEEDLQTSKDEFILLQGQVAALQYNLTACQDEIASLQATVNNLEEELEPFVSLKPDLTTCVALEFQCSTASECELRCSAKSILEAYGL